MDLDPLTVGLTFASVSSSNSSTVGVSLVDVVGTFSATGGSITGATGTSFNVDGGAPAVTYSGTITHASNGTRTIEIQSMAGGSASFGGAVSATDGTGIRIANNTGTNPIAFTSTVDLGTSVDRISDGTAFTMSGNSAATTVTIPDLDVFTSGQTAVSASGSGTLDADELSINTVSNGRALDLDGILSLLDVDSVTCSHNSNCVDLTSLAATSNTTFAGVGLTCTGGTCFNAGSARTVEVTGAANTISATNAVGLNMTNTTIGAGAATFESISASGAANGIVLDTTGTMGGLNVTGDGSTAGSGGTIQNTTANSVSLTSTQDVALHFMNVTGSAANGVLGSNVTGFTLNNATVTNNGDQVNEGGLRFDQNLLGTATISDSTISGSAEHNIEIINTSGTLTLLSISNTDITTNSATLGADGLLLETRNSAQATVEVTGSMFDDNHSDGIQISAIDSSSASLTVTGSNFTSTPDASPTGSVGARGIVLSPASNADLTFDIGGPLAGDANTFSNFSPSIGEEAINLALVSTTTTSSSLIGTIGNNTFSNSGGGVGADLRGDGVATLDISNNTMTSGINEFAIDVITGDAAGDAAVLNLTALNNAMVVQNRDAFFIGALRATSLCMNIRGNSATPGSGDDAYVIFGDLTTGAVELESGPTDCSGSPCTDAEGHITSNNTGTPVTVVGVSLVAPGTCSTP